MCPTRNPFLVHLKIKLQILFSILTTSHKNTILYIWKNSKYFHIFIEVSVWWYTYYITLQSLSFNLITKGQCRTMVISCKILVVIVTILSRIVFANFIQLGQKNFLWINFRTLIIDSGELDFRINKSYVMYNKNWGIFLMKQ